MEVKKRVKVLTLKESIERWDIVQAIKNNPDLKVTLLGGVLTIIGGGMRLKASKDEFKDSVFMYNKNDHIGYKVPAKKLPTVNMMF